MRQAAFLHTLDILSCHQIHKLSLQAPKLGEDGDKDAWAINRWSYMYLHKIANDCKVVVNTGSHQVPKEDSLKSRVYSCDYRWMINRVRSLETCQSVYEWVYKY